jgi:putative lipoic acid-binding regulatory protein
MTSEFYIQTYDNLSSIEKKSFLNFCKSSYKENLPASKNMWGLKNNYSLPYLLNFTDRFSQPKGIFYILFDKNKVIGTSGTYISDFSNNISLAGVRTWIDKKYRHLNINKEYFLPIQKQWAIEKKIKIVALSFNEYNKNLIQVFKRSRLGEKSNRISTRQSRHLFFNGLCEVPFTVKIQNTEQWVIYEKLDNDFKFNWDQIKWKD